MSGYMPVCRVILCVPGYITMCHVIFEDVSEIIGVFALQRVFYSFCFTRFVFDKQHKGLGTER